MKTIKLSDLRPDDHNANKGTERGMAMLEHSQRSYGLGRSVLSDKNLKLIAGNKTVETAIAAGFEEAIIVPTNGKQLVVVQRTDLDLDQDIAAKELAIADNRTGETSLNWDPEILKDLETEVDLSKFWSDEEFRNLTEIISDVPETEEEDSATEKPFNYIEQYGVIVLCDGEAGQQKTFNRLADMGYKCKVVTT